MTIYQPLFAIPAETAEYKPAATFDDWMAKVDAYCSANVGLSIHDLPDVNFADMFADGWSPKRTVQLAIREAGGL